MTQACHMGPGLKQGAPELSCSAKGCYEKLAGTMRSSTVRGVAGARLLLDILAHGIDSAAALGGDVISPDLWANGQLARGVFKEIALPGRCNHHLCRRMIQSHIHLQLFAMCTIGCRRSKTIWSESCHALQQPQRMWRIAVGSYESIESERVPSMWLVKHSMSVNQRHTCQAQCMLRLAPPWQNEHVASIWAGGGARDRPSRP